jgi:hypothetical protein
VVWRRNMRHVTDGELHAYLDGSLDLLLDGRGSEVRDHISNCSVCQERLQDEEAVRAQAQDLLDGPAMPEVALPSFEDLKELAAAPGAPPLDEETEDAETVRYRGPLRGVPLAWAATIVVALGVGWMGGQIRGPRPEGESLIPAELRYEEADVSSLQRVNLREDPEEGLDSFGLPPETNIPNPPDQGRRRQGGPGQEGGGQAPGEGQAVEGVTSQATAPRVEGTAPFREAQVETAAGKPSDPQAAVDLLGSAAKVISDSLFRDQAAPFPEASARTLLTSAPRGAAGSAPEAEAQIPDSLENSLAVPGLKVVAIEWEERVPGEKALLIRQLLSRGDTLELRYLGMLLGADADAGSPKEARGSLEEAPGGRRYANVLEASLPAGWNQVVMEWGRGLLVARAPVTEQNLKALLKTLH